jgi:signal transduction histidine kinase
MATDQGKRKPPPSRRDRIKIDLLIHDLKVPLAVIDAGISSLLSRQEKYGPLTDKQEKVLLRALRNTKVTQALVSDALELGRSAEGITHLSSFTLSSLIQQALVEIFDLSHSGTSDEVKCCTDLSELRALLRDRGMILDMDESLWCEEVCLDEVKVRQILRNLLNNALKFCRSRVELSVDMQGDALLLSVKDDGEGIPSVYHNKIFECYFQMNGEEACPVRGHGLGLAGVMVLVEDMGGKLILESDEGAGACFVVQVPLGRK